MVTTFIPIKNKLSLPKAEASARGMSWLSFLVTELFYEQPLAINAINKTIILII